MTVQPAASFGGGAVAYLICVLLHFLSEPVRWRIVFGGDRLRPYLHVYFLTALMSYLLPAKLGLPLRVLMLNRRLGVPLGSISAGLVMDALVSYGSWLLIGGVAGMVVLGRMPEEWRYGFLLGGGALVVGGGLLMAVRRRRVGDRVRAAWWNGAAWARVGLRGGAGLLLAVAVDIASHAGRHLALATLLGLDVPPGDLAVLAVFAVFAGIVSFMPMGLGGYDVTLAAGLIGLGAPPDAAAAMVLANRVGTLTVSAVLGLWSAHALGFEWHGLRDRVGRLLRSGRDADERSGS